jgi:hypothetical protein
LGLDTALRGWYGEGVASKEGAYVVDLRAIIDAVTEMAAELERYRDAFEKLAGETQHTPRPVYKNKEMLAFCDNCGDLMFQNNTKGENSYWDWEFKTCDGVTKNATK